MKNLEYYLKLPYTVILRRDEDGDIVARVDELSGCAAHGKTAEEALNNLQEAQTLWISDCLEQGDPVPEPFTEEGLPSGKWVQRVPRSLHKKLVELSKREKVSLNQLVTSLLSEAVGVRAAVQDSRSEKRVSTDPFVVWLHGTSVHTHQAKSARPVSNRWYIKQTGSRPVALENVVTRFGRLLPNRLEIKEPLYGYNQEKGHQHKY